MFKLLLKVLARAVIIAPRAWKTPPAPRAVYLPPSAEFRSAPAGATRERKIRSAIEHARLVRWLFHTADSSHEIESFLHREWANHLLSLASRAAAVDSANCVSQLPVKHRA